MVSKLFRRNLMQYFHSNDDNFITCLLCKHYCKLKKDSNGICKINYNIDGKLINTTYGYPSALNVDPIEKKPLYHFLPSSLSLSLGTVGCNLRCPFCQNYSISQTSQVNKKQYFSPEDIVQLALKYGAKSISYTYNEPTIWYPYAKDIGELARKNGLKNVFVSSGFESNEVMEDMKSWVDAANIDLKSFSHEYYKKVLKADLQGVLDNLIEFAASDIWLEITTLLIPNTNDSDDEINAMSQFVASSLGLEIPWHFSAFHPTYKMTDTPATPSQTLQLAKEIANKAGIKYVYLGNIKNDSSTYCANCGEKLIDREGFASKILNLENSKCKKCGNLIKGVWQ